jgi:hypothetical protein
MDKNELYGLLAVAEEQQKAVEEAIRGLVIERARLTEGRVSLEKAAESVGKTVRDAVAESLAGASETAAEAIEEAAKPLLGQMERATKTAEAAEQKISAVARRLDWQWAIYGVAAIVCVTVVLSVGNWFQGQRLAALSAEVTEMQTRAELLKERGGKLKFTACGQRACIRIENPKNLYGSEEIGWYLVPEGSWKMPK